MMRMKKNAETKQQAQVSMKFFMGEIFLNPYLKWPLLDRGSFKISMMSLDIKSFFLITYI